MHGSGWECVVLMSGGREEGEDDGRRERCGEIGGACQFVNCCGGSAEERWCFVMRISHRLPNK